MRRLGVLGSIIGLSLGPDGICLAQVPSDSAWLRGVVVTPTRRPIADVQIDVLGQPTRASSDTSGRFLLRGIVPGDPLVVRFRRIGFNAEYFRASLKPGEAKDLEVVMTPGAYELPEVNVIARNAKPIEYAWTTRFDDFFRRKAVGLGVYRTREDIERTMPLRTANILSGIAGIRLRFLHLGTNGTAISFSRCERVSVWIDGRKQLPERAAAPPGVGGSRRVEGQIVSEMLERVTPSQIEMVEIYRSAAEMPAEFIDDSCAAIAIWTR